MPIIKVEILEGRAQALKEKIATEITEVIARHLGSDPKNIHVIFDEIKPDNWAVAGTFFSQRQKT